MNSLLCLQRDQTYIQLSREYYFLNFPAPGIKVEKLGEMLNMAVV